MRKINFRALSILILGLLTPFIQTVTLQAGTLAQQ